MFASDPCGRLTFPRYSEFPIIPSPLMHLLGWPGKAVHRISTPGIIGSPIPSQDGRRRIGRQAVGSEYVFASIIATRNNPSVHRDHDWLSSLLHGDVQGSNARPTKNPRPVQVGLGYGADGTSGLKNFPIRLFIWGYRRFRSRWADMADLTALGNYGSTLKSTLAKSGQRANRHTNRQEGRALSVQPAPVRWQIEVRHPSCPARRLS